VEAADFVRAIVRTVARADAAVVDHVVQAFGAVDGGADGAYLFAGRVLALLAWDRLEECRRIIERWVVARWIICRGMDRLLVITIDADPVHFAAAHNLIFADNRNVVFRLARDDTSVAAVAFIQVDGH